MKSFLKSSLLIVSLLEDGYILTYEYSGSTVIEKSYDDQGLEGTVVGQLNKQGLCISLSHVVGYPDKFEYDNNGYQKSSIYFSLTNTQTFNYTVSKGNYVTSICEKTSKTSNSAVVNDLTHFKSAFIPSNLEKSVVHENRFKSATLNPIIKTEWQFYTDKAFSLGNANRGISFYGKQNKNPIKKSYTTYTDLASGFES